MAKEVVPKLNPHFLAWETHSRNVLVLRTCYVKIGGGLAEGVLLSQLVYWFLPDQHGRYKTRISKGGTAWVAKSRTEWADELGLTPRQVDLCLKNLENRGLIRTALLPFQGRLVKHFTIESTAIWQAILNLSPSPNGEGPLPIGEGPSPFGEGPLRNGEGPSPFREGITETTQENTQETTTKNTAETTETWEDEECVF